MLFVEKTYTANHLEHTFTVVKQGGGSIMLQGGLSSEKFIDT